MKVVTIDNVLLQRMIGDANFLAALPPLKTLLANKRTRVKKSCCGGSTTSTIPATVYDQTRMEIANMLSGNASLQAQLKNLLQAEVLRIRYPQPGKKHIHVIKKF